MVMRQHKEKRALTCSPFIQEFQYGKVNQAYSAYQWMVCHLDDYMDVLKVLFEDKYNLMFLSDHSCGHDKKRSDGLIVENMKKDLRGGGGQPKMQETKIESTYGFLGKFPSKLKESDIQSMMFQKKAMKVLFGCPLKSAKVKFDKGRGKIKIKNCQSKSLVRNIAAKIHWQRRGEH
jgi:hypothetical protein